MTYSIVAHDPATGELGVAVQSHYFDVGKVVPWAEAGVGAVATQSIPDIGYGPHGLDRMRAGTAAPDALIELVAADELEMVRQVAMVDANGEVGVHTGAGCVVEAGHRIGNAVSVQANMMLRNTVPDAMFDAYSGTDGDLTARLLAALDAAEAEGGDIRGRQSAALLVVGSERSDAPWDHVRFDLRVDDHPEPLVELRRLVDYARAFEQVQGVLFGGLLFAPEIDESMSDALEAGLAALESAQAVIGDNREPMFWTTVLLAKAGRIDDARVALRRATETNADWAQFLHRLPASGILPPDEELLARLTAD